MCAQWVAKDPSFLHADSEDSDQTGWMPMMIGVFAGRTCHFVGFVMRWLKCACTASWPETWLFFLKYFPVPYIVCANSKGSGETAWSLRRSLCSASPEPSLFVYVKYPFYMN